MSNRDVTVNLVLDVKLRLPGHLSAIFSCFYPNLFFGDDAFECRGCCAFLHDGPHVAGRQGGCCSGVQLNRMMH